MTKNAILGATNRPQPNPVTPDVRQSEPLGCACGIGRIAPEPLTRHEVARLLMEPEARDTLTDAQLVVATLWSRGASVTSIAEGTGRTRQAASKSLRLVREKLTEFAAAIAAS